MSAVILSCVLIVVLVAAFFLNVDAFSAFVCGAKKGIELAKSILPFIAATMIVVSLLRHSGVIEFLTTTLSPVLSFLGVDASLVELIILKPFSGSGSLAIFEGIVAKNGANSHVAKCAAVIMGSSETVFFVSATYFAKANIKKLGLSLPIALFVTFFSSVLACHFCKIV